MNPIPFVAVFDVGGQELGLIGLVLLIFALIIIGVIRGLRGK